MAGELSWVREGAATWDADKRRIVGGAPAGVFPGLRALADGAPVPDEWWRAVDAAGNTLGYGWMDVTWGDAEVLLAVASDARGSGVGTFILDQLAHEAAERGIRYLYNVIPAAHPDPESLRAWLERRGFAPSGEGGLLRRRTRG